MLFRSFGGPNGLDSRYVTLAGEQSGEYNTPTVSGNKTITGAFNFGFNPVSGQDNNPTIAPQSYQTNTKFNFAGGAINPSFDQKFSSLLNSDLITKEILVGRLASLYIDNGFYARADSTCNNYAGTPSSNQCPVG